MRNIGLFGGTFNPPHLGHKRLAFEIAEKVSLDEIIVMPTYVPPHKEANNLAKSEDRLEMCRLTFLESIFTVSDIEIKRGGKSYTYDTLVQLKQLYPNDKLFLIVGSDMLLCFDKWYRCDDILSMCTLCVISRENEKSSAILKSYAENTLHLNADKSEIIISEIQPLELSSTQIRKNIAEGRDISVYMEENTIQYLKEKGLYK